MRIEVTIDGETTEVEIDPNLDRFSLRELVRLEQALGGDVFDRLMGARRRGGPIPPRPSILQAILWAKVATVYPVVGLNDFDLEMEDLVSSVLPSAETPIPMEVDGVEQLVMVDGDEGNV